MDNMLHDIFIQEAEENLHILESRIISIEENPDDDSMVNDAFRAIHSIKGGAGLAGFTGIKDFTHIVEDLFEHIRSGALPIEENLISIILKSMDIMKMMISNIKGNIESNEGIETEENIKQIKELLNETDSEPENKEQKKVKNKKHNLFYINLVYYEEIFNVGIDPLMFIADLEKEGTILYIHTDTTGFPKLSNFNPEHFYLKWQLFFETEKSEKQLLDIFCFVVHESKIVFKNLNDISDNREALAEYSINGHTLLDFKQPPEPEKMSEPEKKETQISEEEKPVLHNRRATDKIPPDKRVSDVAAGSYIRVPTEKLEKIFNTVSELLISQARLNMLSEEYEDIIPDSYGTVTDSLKNITKLLQEQITSLRMMSLDSTFDRFKRVVRDIASDKGKKIELQISGKETELDKNMIEKLNDPLKHLVRNCIDHGIETEAERLEKGKPIKGILKLSAFLESGKVVIEVTDDGQGINREKLLKKAEDKGLVPKDVRLSDGEILNLIFHPGLSTAEKVTDLSGRGVGMDVVKSCINELHGNIDIISEEDEGTTFKLYLPLTLAILDGMLISVGREKYIIPTLAILEIFRPKNMHLKTISGGGEVVFFRGDYIPLIRLHEIFNVDEPILEAVKAELIVINNGGIKAAILVDNVLEQYQIVLKSLQKNFHKVDNISSATILGDGDVALIVDIQSLVQNNKKGQNVQKV